MDAASQCELTCAFRHAALKCGLEPLGSVSTSSGSWGWGNTLPWNAPSSQPWHECWGGSGSNSNSWSGGQYRQCLPGYYKANPGEAWCQCATTFRIPRLSLLVGMVAQ